MVIFISTDYIKSNFPILDYVKDGDIQPWVRSAQETYLRQYLGDPVYRRIVEAGPTGELNEKEQELLDYYIKPTLMWWSIYLYGRFCNFKFTNKGISKQNSEFSEPAEFREITYAASGIKDIAESYSQQLITFLSYNKDVFDYPCENGDKKPVHTSFNFGGIYVPQDHVTVVDTRR